MRKAVSELFKNVLVSRCGRHCQDCQNTHLDTEDEDQVDVLDEMIHELIESEIIVVNRRSLLELARSNAPQSKLLMIRSRLRDDS